MRPFVLAATFYLAAAAVQAATETESLNLQGTDRFWAVLASRQDADEAAAAAMRQRDGKVMVVRAGNGWFAAISGPYSVKAGTGRQFLDGLVKDHGAPKDAYLTRGANFTGVVWKPPATNVLDTLDYDGEHDVSLRKDDLEVKLSRQADGKDDFAATAVATYKGKPAFRMVFAENSSEKPASQVSIVRLDPDSPMPQVVFTYFWQGAHCCTLTKVATLNKEGVWHVVDGDTLDGDGGYVFEDLQAKGFSYLVSSDQSFLYAFDSYAGSLAPIRIQRLAGDTLSDVTKDAAVRSRVLQSLYVDEGAADVSGEDNSWHSNGFLAGWVAGSMLVGRGDAAWSKMLTGYDHNSDFGPDKCTLPLSVDKCPDGKKVKMAFPAALRQHLAEHGYTADPDRLQVPHEVEPKQVSTGAAAPSDAPPQLQTCARASDTVQKLVYQAFAGRNLRKDEAYDAVVLQGDTTLEGYEPALRKVTCAVTYEVTLRPMIGRLAEDGDMGRAQALSRLARRSGGSASKRIRYTVKPTATAGTEFVELLP